LLSFAWLHTCRFVTTLDTSKKDSEGSCFTKSVEPGKKASK
jgi:hypothetical protein